jgi:hypothetical protein
MLNKKESMLTIEDVITSDNYIARCQEKMGIFNRAPNKFDHQSHDDYIGIACTSNILGLWFANYIVAYGKKHFYYYDNTEETTKLEIKNWHGRFPWAIGTYKVCAGYKANWFEQLNMCLYLYVSIKNKDLTDTSGRILRFIQKERWKGRYKLVDKFIKMWEDDIKTRYPKAMGDVLGIYHGKDHPFAIIMEGKV